MAIIDDRDGRIREIARSDGSPEPPLGDLVQTLLGESPALIDFAEAVVRHLSGVDPPRPSAEILRDVVAVLRVVQEEEDPQAVTLLNDRPELLASFFQNADLLDPASPDTAIVARLVMGALEIIDGELE